MSCQISFWHFTRLASTMQNQYPTSILRQPPLGTPPLSPPSQLATGDVHLNCLWQLQAKCDHHATATDQGAAGQQVLMLQSVLALQAKTH